MTHNPILTAVAQAAAAVDLPISGITVSAPLVTGNPVLVITWADMLKAAAAMDDMPAGVTGTVWSARDRHVAELPAMISAEPLIIAAAWAQGAWDIQRVAIAAGYDGGLPDHVDRQVAEQWRAQGWISWYWRPMLRGPEIRAKQRRPDITLDRWSLGRPDAPPEVRTVTIRPGQEVVIRLGRHKDKPQPDVMPATAKQRSYLASLLATAGRDTTLPDDLDMRQASAWIDSLTGETPPEPSRKPDKRKTMITINQWRLIEFYRRRRGDKPLSPAVLRTLTYAEAQVMLDEMRTAP